MIDISYQDVENEVAETLKRYVERIERLTEEKESIQEQIKEVYASIGSEGFDVKVLKQIIKLRKMDEEARESQERLLDVYKRALDMV